MDYVFDDTCREPSPERLKKIDVPAPLETEIEVHRHNLAVLQAWIAHRRSAVALLQGEIAGIAAAHERLAEALEMAEISLANTQRN